MKREYVKDLLGGKPGSKAEAMGWLKSRRDSGGLVFLTLVDSTGEIQAVLSKNNSKTGVFSHVLKIPLGSAIIVNGALKEGKNSKRELEAEDILVVGQASKQVCPRPRERFDIFSSECADHVLKHRALYLRNEKLAAVLKFKSNFIQELHSFFRKKEFTFVDAPILTKLLLYDDESAFQLDYGKGEKVFLSQCCTFQLEAAIHAFERVYNITPSFRAEHSRSSRHLREYYHLKAEVAWANLDDLVSLAEEMLSTVSRRTAKRSRAELKTLGVKPDSAILKPPFKRISYNRASEIIGKAGKDFKWGKSLGIGDEEILTKKFGNKPLWVYGIPCSAEAFPFAKDPENPEITRTCDLIASNGFGELLGTAEKITDKEELLERMAEKGKTTKKQMKRYQWYVDLREQGMPPHGGIGMGVERVIRFLLGIPHVRDTISFPRLVRRRPNP